MEGDTYTNGCTRVRIHRLITLSFVRYLLASGNLIMAV